MEHIVQFAIGIDDESIRKRVTESAYNDIVKQLIAEAKKDVGLSGYYYDEKTNWKRLIDDALQKYINNNKDLVIDLAATKLAESIRRSKAFKEKIDSIIEKL